MKTTINDVAREAGVSVTTVSRVLNDNYPVKKETKVKVQAAIEKLKFSPNYLARGLVNQKTHTVGVVVPGVTNMFFPTVVKAVSTVLKAKGYTIYLCDTDNSGEEEKSYIKSLIQKQVDGIIVVDPNTDNIIEGFYDEVSKEIPLVCINGYNKGVKCNFVINDEEVGAIEAVEHLINLGHKEIAFVRGEKSYSYDIKEEAYKSILDKNTLNYKDKIINIGDGNSDDTVENTMKLMEVFFEENKNLTAFFCCNDLMALGVMNAAKKKGFSIPGDISVIGFDNILISKLVEPKLKKKGFSIPGDISVIGFDNILISKLVEPKLTTVDQNMYLLGENAAIMLLRIIEEEKWNTQRMIINTELVVRGSSGRIKSN